MKKSITKNYKKVWILLSVLCVLVIVAGVSAADAPGRPEPASPSGEQVQVVNLGVSTTAELMGTTATGDLFQDAADRLAALQNDDGGWDWPLDDGNPANVSPLNTIGPIAQGLAIAYLHTGDPAHLAALQDAGALLLTKTNNFSPSDGYLAAQLDAIFGGTTFVDHLQANFYGPLAGGTYNRNGAGTLYDTAGYVNLIRTSRASQGIGNLAAWDVAMGLVGAASAGAADIQPWIDGTKAEINELDGSAYYDVIGLAGAVYGLAFVGEDFDPTTGEHAAAGSLADLADILVLYQIDGGGFAWNSLYVIPNDGNETIQETAYAVLALSEVHDAGYQGAIFGAVDYLKSTQLPTGGWENYAGDGENHEITGEALWAIGSIASVDPEIAEPLVCDEATVDIAINDVEDLYGYEFKVTYDKDLVTADGELDYSWFDDNASGSSPGGWEGDCDNVNGVCRFARTEYRPDLALSGSGVVATVAFTSKLPAAPETATVQVTDLILTDRDGFQITPAEAGSLELNVCGNATVSGTLSLQGRLVPNHQDFSVTLNGPFPAPVPAINQGAGTYSFSNVKYTSGGTNYVIQADHSLYLLNEKDPLEVKGDVTGEDTRLLGGDANNDGLVFIGDLSCIAGDFNKGTISTCGGAAPNSSDINNDGFVNIQDLAIAGGNYNLSQPQPW